jgi:hypothetical protein
MSQTPTHRLLDIYVGESCLGCERARELAAQIQGWQLPDVTVRLRDIDDPETHQPDSVFAVPTYLLNGRVISLGNPEAPRLYHLLTSDPGGTA